MPTDAFTDGYMYLYASPANSEVENDFYVFAETDSGVFADIAFRTGTTSPITMTAEQLAAYKTLYFVVAGYFPEEGQSVNQYAAAHISLWLSPYYFMESSLGIYITPQQLEQFKNMYPDCVSDAYRNAVGELTAEVGNRFDMAAMLGEADEAKKDDTIRWILQVMTAYNIASPSLNYSEPLEMAYKKVAQTIIKLKGGMVSLEEPAAYRNDKFSANAEVITNRYQYRG